LTTRGRRQRSMSKVILVAEEIQEGDEPLGEATGEPIPEWSGDSVLKGPDPSSLKPSGGRPRQNQYVPSQGIDLEGIASPLEEEPEKYAGKQPKEKIWVALTDFEHRPNVWIRYRSLKNRVSERTLSMFDDPKAGIFWGRTTQQPYVTAWDDQRNDWSRFRMNQIEDARVLPRAP